MNSPAAVDNDAMILITLGACQPVGSLCFGARGGGQGRVQVWSRLPEY